MATRLGALVGGQKRFLGDVAHELCSPLARLRVALGILEQRAGPEQMPYVASASGKAQQMADLVNELLSFSKASLGPSVVQPRPVSVQGLVEDTVAREAVQGCEIRQVVEGDLTVLGDPDLLRRALANLVRNAIRYAGDYGPIRVHARQAGDRAEIRVADSGPGVPAEELALIFDPFYRLDASRDPGTGGAGLGLTIVRTCVEACRGTVSARNREPQGLEVLVTLPSAPGPEAGAEG
jgi:two-component system sensor histidine kinase CpxA